jgi:hypothetical protein
MTEQELIDIINALIDADLQGECQALKPKDIARRALDAERYSSPSPWPRSSARGCEPWKWPPGARPRLKSRKDGISRLIPKPSVAELLEAGRQAGEPIDVTLARVRRAYPTMNLAALQVNVESDAAWLLEFSDDLTRELERLKARIGRITLRASRKCEDTHVRH